MWAVISLSKHLKFYDFNTGQFTQVKDICFAKVEDLDDANGVVRTMDGFTQVVLDHEQCVSQLLNAGIPLFLKKTEARNAATSINLTGFKYLKLEPKIIKV